MKWWGPVTWLSALCAVAGASGPSSCTLECMKVYTLHHKEFEQPNYSLDACVSGCDIFSRIEVLEGTQQPLENLKNCNYSCDERYEPLPSALLPACQSGCGFHFDTEVTRAPAPSSPSFRPRSDGPIPIFSRPVAVSPQPPQQPIRVGQSPVVPFRPQNPFMQMFSRAQAPGPQVIMRKNVNIPMAMMPRSMAMADPNNRVPKALNISPEFPEAHRSSENIVTKQIPNGPTVIGFSLPQLLSKVNSLLPQLSQGNTPRVMEISINRNPFESFEENFEEFPAAFNKFSRQEEMQLPELPRMMDGLFGRSDAGLQPLIKEVEDLFGDEETLEEEVEHFMDDEENFFGRKDDDIEPFSGLFSQFGQMMNSLPQLGQLRGLMPWSGPNGVGGGKLTVIKAGPGFHEEKSYDIGPDGQFSEVKPVSMMHDGLNHANPMDTHFDIEDVEMIPLDNNKVDSDIVEIVEAAPVMDVRGLEEQEPAKENEEEAVTEVKEIEAEELPQLPYLSVLRGDASQEARDWSERLLASYRELAEREYLDTECSHHNLSWSDWVSCLHAKVGVPRWLTAATISLGIIFSLWLCLVIPSTAPKRKVKTVFIKGEKPSAALNKAVEVAAKAKAKEAEAAGFNPGDYMVAVINVSGQDLPPTYDGLATEAVPASPAPSYRSDMASQATAVVIPGSPAPSYRSVDGEQPLKVSLEPVHEKKESTA